VFDGLAGTARDRIEAFSDDARRGVDAGVDGRRGLVANGVYGTGGHADAFVHAGRGRVDGAVDNAGFLGGDLAWCGMSLDYGEGGWVCAGGGVRAQIDDARGGGRGYIPSGFTVFTGVFLTGVDFTGVGPVVFLSALTEGFVGVLAAGVFLMAVGRGFFVAAGVEVADFEVSPTVFLAGATAGFLTDVVVAAGLLADATGNDFCVPSGVLALAGAALDAAGVDGEAPAALSFLGTRLTGAAAVSVLLVAEAIGFFTGVGLAFEAVVVAVFTGVFVACPAFPATLEIFPTLAVMGVNVKSPIHRW
jgi:hypothetical protein